MRSPLQTFAQGTDWKFAKKNPAVSLNIRIRIYMLQFCFAEELPSFSGLKIKKNTDQLILVASDSSQEKKKMRELVTIPVHRDPVE